MPVSEAWRRIIEKGQEELFLVGATANTFEDILKADREGASYIGLGPYRYTETKKNLSPILGLEGYRKIIGQCREAGLEIPIFAIGGIEFEDIAPLMETGIEGIAVSGERSSTPKIRSKKHGVSSGRSTNINRPPAETIQKYK